LRGADLRNATLDDARLGEAIYDVTTIWPEGFDVTTTGAKLAE
jgi:uncharacterized protein YjbI with pentapeptide repeats